MMAVEKLVRLEDAREQLRPLQLGELLTMDIPAREMLLAPVIQAGGLAMLYAPRGIGKTHLALASPTPSPPEHHSSGGSRHTRARCSTSMARCH